MDILQIQQIILKNTYTKTDYLHRVAIIRRFLENRFYKGSKNSFSDFLTNEDISPHDKKALAPLDEHFFNLFTPENFYLVLTGLREALASLPNLTLYLPVILEDINIDLLGRWFRQNLNPELIIELRINPTLVTGLAYVWHNKYKDLSLHYLLNKNENLLSKIIDAYASQI